VSEIYLGVIAFAVFVMAAIQVAAVVFAARAVRRVDRLVDRIEQDFRPVAASLQSMTADAARAAALAAAQVERVDRLFSDIAREGAASLNFLKAALAAFQGVKGPASPGRANVEDEDALFIG
jgi:hypothetical protein